jgi:hypothetical protein
MGTTGIDHCDNGVCRPPTLDGGVDVINVPDTGISIDGA